MTHGPVGLTALDRRHLGVRRAADVPDDAVGETVRLRGLRPLSEVGIANELDALPRDVSGDHVRARRGDRPRHEVIRRLLRHGVRERKRELVQELRVRSGEAEGHGARAVVRHDSA